MSDELTRREREAAGFAVSGLSNRQVADRMSLTEGTVKQYLHRAYDKLGAWGRRDLAGCLPAFSTPRQESRK